VDEMIKGDLEDLIVVLREIRDAIRDIREYNGEK